MIVSFTAVSLSHLANERQKKSAKIFHTLPDNHPHAIVNPMRTLTRKARRTMARAGRKASPDAKRAAGKKGHQAMLQFFLKNLPPSTPHHDDAPH